ncbi:lysophospholipid acyltransferase family protein [Nanoarchaeota archaeon]
MENIHINREKYMREHEKEIKVLRKLFRINPLYKVYHDFFCNLKPRTLFDSYSVVAGMLMKNKKISIEGIEHIPKKGPAIFSSGHPNWIEPFFLGYVLYCNIEKEHQKAKFLGDAAMSNLDDFSAYFNRFFVRDGMKDNFLTYLMADTVSHIVAPIFTLNDSIYIPVFRGKEGREETYRRTIKALKNDEYIIMFPENPDAKDVKDENEMVVKKNDVNFYRLQGGIVGIVERAYENKLEVPIIPSSIKGGEEDLFKKGEIIIKFSEPVYYSDYGDREKFLVGLQEKMANDFKDLFGEK